MFSGHLCLNLCSSVFTEFKDMIIAAQIRLEVGKTSHISDSGNTQNVVMKQNPYMSTLGFVFFYD